MHYELSTVSNIYDNNVNYVSKSNASEPNVIPVQWNSPWSKL